MLPVQPQTTSVLEGRRRRRSRWSPAADGACGRGIFQLDRVAVPDGMLLVPRDSGPQATDHAACTEKMAAQSVLDSNVKTRTTFFTCAFCKSYNDN